MEAECDLVLSAIRRGEASLPAMRRATSIEYARLQIVLYKLEFDWRSIIREDTADGYARYYPAESEKIRPVEKGSPVSISPSALRDTKAAGDARQFALEQRDAPWCIECRQEVIGAGYDRNGRKRWRCKVCGITFLGTGAVNHVKQQKRTAAIEAFKSAKSVRKVAAEVGISEQTARRIRDEEIKETILCPCGKDAKHQGWCRFRYEQSPTRQATIKEMNMGRIEEVENQPSTGLNSNGNSSVAAAQEPRKGVPPRPLDPQLLEDLLAQGKTMEEICKSVNLSAAMLYQRRDRQPEIKQAFERGRERYWEEKNQRTDTSKKGPAIDRGEPAEAEPEEDESERNGSLSSVEERPFEQSITSAINQAKSELADITKQIKGLMRRQGLLVRAIETLTELGGGGH